MTTEFLCHIFVGIFQEMNTFKDWLLIMYWNWGLLRRNGQKNGGIEALADARGALKKWCAWWKNGRKLMENDRKIMYIATCETNIAKIEKQ